MTKPVKKAHPKKGGHKKIPIHPRHAKPYRKRHYGLLIISVVALLVLFGLLVQFRYKVDSGIRSARNFIADSLRTDEENEAVVNSSYGFSFTYDPKLFYVSAVDGSTGELYTSEDLQISRPYQTLRLSSTSVNATDAQSGLTIDYVLAVNVSDPSQLEATEKQLVVDKQNADSTLTKIDSQMVTIGGKQFLKTTWKQQPKDAIVSRFTNEFTTYITAVNGKALIIKASYGVDGQPTDVFNDTITSFTFGQSARVPSVSSAEVAAKVEASRSILDSLLGTQLAQAATQGQSAEQTSALYAPAVVKVFNVFCMDIQIDKKPYLNGACSGASGSGFFISSNGYIATNGHVVNANPKDIVIYDALSYMLKGNSQYFKVLVALSGLSDSDLATAKTQDEALDMAVDKFYQIPDSRFTTVNGVHNLLVDLNDKQPDTKELINLTNARKEYPASDNIKRAKIVAQDYRMLDGITQFHNSDVAIIKIDGNDYPVAKLGNISEAGQGTNLAVLGFPGIAGNNGLIDSSQSKVTLTTGKVSAVKNAAGSDKKLIETDATIGHGNSGGPVFSEAGNVVGIATYTADGGGSGNGTFNYIRDIQDIKDLAAESGIRLDAASPTQSEWQKAIALFYNARYSKALKSFSMVQDLYPQHPTAADFIANSQQKIANGEDVKDFPVAIVLIAGIVVAFIGAGVAAFLIIRHHGKHQLYKVASGQAVAAPAGFGNLTDSVTIPAISQGAEGPAPQQAAPAPSVAPAEPTPPVEPTPAPPQPPVYRQPQTPQQSLTPPTEQPPTPPAA